MTDAPGPYRVSQNTLYRYDEELLRGHLIPLEQFRDVLNAADPDDLNVPAVLRALIRMTRDCSFAVGPRLLQDGTPLKLATPQKPKNRPPKRRGVVKALTEVPS